MYWPGRQGVGEVESRKPRGARAGCTHTHTLSHSLLDRFTFTQKHALRQVITATQSGTWTPTQPLTHPGNRGLAVCQTSPAQTGCLVRHIALSSGAVRVLWPRTWWTSEGERGAALGWALSRVQGGRLLSEGLSVPSGQGFLWYSLCPSIFCSQNFLSSFTFSTSCFSLVLSFFPLLFSVPQPWAFQAYIFP